MPVEFTEIDPLRVREFVTNDPVVRKVALAADGMPIWLVGGSVRDLLVGKVPSELDFVVEGPVANLAVTLDPSASLYETFGTAELLVGDTAVDLAQTRSETYPEPGALPVVSSADLATDLQRRDFSVNAMAFPVDPVGDLIDPLGGLADLRAGTLRMLHPDSFLDDPTRALRAARYCARLGLEPDQETLEALRSTDLETVSGARIERELGLIAREEDPASAIDLLASWGVIDVQPVARTIAEPAFEAVRAEPWRGSCTETELVTGLLSRKTLDAAASLARDGEPSDPWEGYRAARSVDPVVLLLAKSLGADWVELWPAEWAEVELEISGSDLIASGIPEGPSVGEGLEAALRDRVRLGKGGRERELSIALERASRDASS